MPRFSVVPQQLRQTEMKRCRVQLLRLPFFHPLRNLPNIRGEEYCRVTLLRGRRVQVCSADSQLLRQPVLIPSWANICLGAGR